MNLFGRGLMVRLEVEKIAERELLLDMSFLGQIKALWYCGIRIAISDSVIVVQSGYITFRLTELTNAAAFAQIQTSGPPATL